MDLFEGFNRRYPPVFDRNLRRMRRNREITLFLIKKPLNFFIFFRGLKEKDESGRKRLRV
ncbi:hypothetical protein Hanom_Chr06g00490461 [Helianthus anomalus]